MDFDWFSIVSSEVKIGLPLSCFQESKLLSMTFISRIDDFSYINFFVQDWAIISLLEMQSLLPVTPVILFLISIWFLFYKLLFLSPLTNWLILELYFFKHTFIVGTCLTDRISNKQQFPLYLLHIKIFKNSKLISQTFSFDFCL